MLRKKGTLKRLATVMACLMLISCITALSYAAWSSENNRKKSTTIASGDINELKLGTVVISNTLGGAAITNEKLIPVDESDAITESVSTNRRFFVVTVTVEKAEANYELVVSTTTELQSGSSLRYSTDPVTAGAGYVAGTGHAITATPKCFFENDSTTDKVLCDNNVAAGGVTNVTYTFYLFLESSNILDANNETINLSIELRYYT